MLQKFRISKSEMKTIRSSNIRKYRNEKCYTQEYMAEKLGIGQSTYQKIETGEITLSMDRLLQIASILAKPVEAFINNSDGIYENNSELPLKEIELMQKIILYQEKRIEELEAKVERKNMKIEELKLALNSRD